MDKRWNNDSLTFGIGMLSVIAFLGLTIQGCGENRHMVLASTSTNIGVEISQNPATQSPQAKLGYQRVELAIVPSNRTTKDDVSAANSMHNGAKDVADVVMELRYGGIFDLGATSGIYQRLAVGSIAVTQPGASLMFAKDASGTVTKDATNAIKSLRSVQSTPPGALKKLNCLKLLREDVTKKNKIDAAVKTGSGLSWDEFTDTSPSDEQVDKVLNELKSENINCGGS